MKPGMESAAEKARRLAFEGLSRPGAPFRELPPRVLLVDVGWQSLTLLEAGVPKASAAISTALAGVGQADRLHAAVPALSCSVARVP